MSAIPGAKRGSIPASCNELVSLFNLNHLSGSYSADSKEKKKKRERKKRSPSKLKIVCAGSLTPGKHAQKWKVLMIGKVLRKKGQGNNSIFSRWVTKCGWILMGLSPKLNPRNCLWRVIQRTFPFLIFSKIFIMNINITFSRLLQLSRKEIMALRTVLKVLGMEKINRSF